MLEIHQKTHEQNYNTVPDTSSGVKQKQSNEKKTNNFGKWKHHTSKRYTTKQPEINTIARTKDKSWKY